MIDNRSDFYVLVGKEEDVNFLITNSNNFTKVNIKDLEEWNATFLKKIFAER